MTLKGMRIGVLMGGTSAEREVSLKSGAAVSSALGSLGHKVVDIDAGPDICEVLGSEKVRAQNAKHGAGKKHRKRALAIGESLGVYRDYPTSKGCTSPFVPIWVNEMVRRQG